jgi:hypothetical protein
MIYWSELVDGYNRIYGTSFKSEEGLYRSVYPDMTLSRLCTVLGVTKHTLYRRFDLYGIERCHVRGGRNNSPGPKTKKLLGIPAEELSCMTIRQTSKVIEASPSWCGTMLKRYSLAYLDGGRECEM